MFEHRYGSHGGDDAVKGRHEEISPELSRLTNSAILAYDSLRPIAVPINEAGDDEHVVLEDFELGGKVVGRYVRVNFEPLHRLNLYDNRTGGRALYYSWQFSRVEPLSPRKTETTVVTKFPVSSTPDGEELIDIHVDAHLLDARGKIVSSAGRTCGTSDLYNDAEGYIADFESDIARAVNEFGV
jgi:hypothetical protein